LATINKNVEVFPIRQDITVIDEPSFADKLKFIDSSYIKRIYKKNGFPDTPKFRDPHKLRLGWKVYEQVGICLVNDYAVSMLEINTEKKPRWPYGRPMGNYVRRIFEQ